MPQEEEAKAGEAATGGEYGGHLDPAANVFDYNDLKGKFPEGIKHDSKEAYLSDE
jgi:hypothetical protein